MKKLFCAALILGAFLLPGLFACADTSENMQIVYDYITQTLGYNRAAACGIMSNIQYESNFRPNAIGDSGAAYGICQWNSRRQSLINYCERNGFESWQDIYGQLGYLGYELENNKKKVGAYLRDVQDTAQGAYDAAYYFCVYFEIPANRYEKGVKRGSTAVTKYFAMYGGTYETYPVRYELAGGSGTVDAQTKIEGVPLTITSALPVRYGYEFMGWSLDPSGGQADFQSGDRYTLNEGATLYALWRLSRNEGMGFRYLDGSWAVEKYDGALDEVSIPPEFDGSPVQTVLCGAFGSVRAVYIPESVNYIEDGAFLPGTLIGAAPGSYAHEYALGHGFGFIALFPEGTLRLTGEIKTMEAEAFALTGILYADLSGAHITGIGEGAFAGAADLKLISIPASVTYIGKNALPAGVTVMAPSDSYAENYAKANGYSFVPIN